MGGEGAWARGAAAPSLRLISLPPALHLGGLSYSDTSFYAGHPNEDQVAYITHFQKEDVEEKEEEEGKGASEASQEAKAMWQGSLAEGRSHSHAPVDSS